MISPDQSQQTVTDKNHPDKNVLQFEDGQERGARGARWVVGKLNIHITVQSLHIVKLRGVIWS